MLTDKEKTFYLLSAGQIRLYNRTGIYPYPTSSGEIDMLTGDVKVEWEMSQEVKDYINKQLSLDNNENKTIN